ncbi:MAG: xanthine dehydrogenase family protein molybdopterin-binding subunit [Immundisolibacterales bacterium]|nr:xanthine dehydrogenase family protein molybdopterin-binding subunit [Immundisolibacterales bacterium]
MRDTTTPTGGIGASVLRHEDARHLFGEGEFVADLRLPGTRDVAFVRSPLAHARVRRVTKPAGREGDVFTAADLAGVSPIHAPSALPGFKRSRQPIFAAERVRHVGEILAACVAEDRAAAEDLAETVALDLEELPAVHDSRQAREPGAPHLHEHWGDNVFLQSVAGTELGALRDEAAVSVTRTFRTARQCMSPLEGRAVLAYRDRRQDMLVVHTACQMPHIVRNGLAECLGLPQGRIRVIAPDVGGGFGYKGILLAEEVFLGWLAMRCGQPVRWIEDRREQLTGNANCREHHYVITGHAAADGRLLGIECEAHVDAGAYSAYPFSAGLEPAQVGSILPGPYVFEGYHCRTWAMATNKPPILPYRGVARTGVCFALEVLLDAMARALGIDPVELRLKNLVRPEQMPFDNITAKHFDSGDYPECLRRAAAALATGPARARIDAPDAPGSPLEPPGPARCVGTGYAVFCEQAAHGTSVYAAWGVPMVPGHEQATARLTPDGGLELRVGVHSHGQGLETTLAQVAHEILGIDNRAVKVVHGDTAYTPYSTGTWGSRCMVMAGGAVAAACEELGERVKHLAAHLLQVAPGRVELRDGSAWGPGGGRVGIAEIGRLWYRQPENLPDDVDPRGLEVTQGYRAVRDSGTFSYACHACVVEVDIESGGVEILDYVVVEDGGVLVNPLIVDGQVLGGAAQGIGTALYEEMPFDEAAQPLASTLADYRLPGAAEVPPIRIEHMESPSPYSRFGQKGLGEGGAIGPPAAIANAINQALAPLGVEVDELPITRERLLEKIVQATK